MTNFITIIKWGSGTASYQVIEGAYDEYTAYLMKNTSAADLPQELVIDKLQTLRAGNTTDALTSRLISAIRSVAYAGEEPS